MNKYTQIQSIQAHYFITIVCPFERLLQAGAIEQSGTRDERRMMKQFHFSIINYEILIEIETGMCNLLSQLV